MTIHLFLPHQPCSPAARRASPYIRTTNSATLHNTFPTLLAFHNNSFFTSVATLWSTVPEDFVQFSHCAPLIMICCSSLYMLCNVLSLPIKSNCLSRVFNILLFWWAVCQPAGSYSIMLLVYHFQCVLCTVALVNRFQRYPSGRIQCT